MAGPDARLRERARRAYEAGRLGAALRRSLLLLPLLGLVFTCCADPARNIAAGTGLLAAVTFCLWRGGALRRGVGPGLVAGLVPLVVPLAIQAGGHACDAGRCGPVPTVCIVAGIAGGILLGLLAPRPREGRGVPLCAASLVAGLAGSVGCALYGFIGLGGMAIGLLAGAVPVLAARRARA